MTPQQPKRTVRVEVDGCPQLALPGQSVAAVLLAMGRVAWRTTRDGGRPRGLFCGIGVCHDCLVVVNGLPDVRACRREAADGDRIETQRGAVLPPGGGGAGEGAAAPTASAAGGPGAAASGAPAPATAGGGGVGPGVAAAEGHGARPGAGGADASAEVPGGGRPGPPVSAAEGRPVGGVTADAGQWAEGPAAGAGTVAGVVGPDGGPGVGAPPDAAGVRGTDASAGGPGGARPGPPMSAAEARDGAAPTRHVGRPPDEPLVVVVGAGPAGMAAALAAGDGGARVVLVDGGARVGGQFHRLPPAGFSGGGGHPLERSVADHPRIEYLSRADVWALEPGPGPGRRHLVHVQQGPADGTRRTPRTLAADALVLCTGAYDRSLPFPGWELPGVVTAGAAQALAKGQRTAIGRRVVVAGTGPFLLPVATSLLAVGARVLGVYEAGSAARWLRHPVTAVRDGGRAKASELSSYAAELARHRVPYRSRSAVVAAHGHDRVEAVTVARLDAGWHIRPGSERRLEGVDAVCTGYGFTPQLELALSAGCALRDGHVIVDAHQATTVPGVYAAGDLTGIGGAGSAAAEGELAGAIAAAASRLTAGPVGAPAKSSAATPEMSDAAASRADTAAPGGPASPAAPAKPGAFPAPAAEPPEPAAPAAAPPTTPSPVAPPGAPAPPGVAVPPTGGP
ncbi:FAD-dependent oxidoreductase, partial [Streptomyces sp. NPDC057654]|uniref:FAD-dependent oxidoreductase n=1 Tax=Streptomyces sp. NPDC057654 TaxID=3346196 RepID=UPI0036A9F97F